MMELITRTARLVPYAKRPKQVPSFVAVHTFEPAADDPAASLGSLFIVVEVLVSGRPGEDVADLIIGSFQDSYYADQDEQTDSLTRFEAAIKATNEALGELVNQGNAAWIGKLSAIITVQAGNEIHLTHSGSAEAYLYRHEASTQITGGTGSKPTGPAKTFGLVASGQLESGDRILLATPALIHQVSLPKLHDIVLTSSPNAAIAELTEILKGSDASRIAALVVDVTTPELAALQVRSTQPSHITLGAPENALEAAKIMAAPLAQATVDTGKKAGQVAHAGWKQTQPKLTKASKSVASGVRTMISGERLAKRGLIVVGVVVIIVAIIIWRQMAAHTNTALIDDYKHAYTTYSQALTTTNPDDKRAALISAQTSVDKLATGSNKRTLDRLLPKASLPAAAPTSVQALQQSINDALDGLDGLVKVKATTVANFDSYKNAKPNFTELSGISLYAIDGNSDQIFVVDITTNSVKKSAADTSKLGKVVATSLSSNNDGLYLLTAEPSVWFYKFAGGSLSQISLGLSGWEPATSISSYGGNLYLLSNGQIEKHVRTSTGFSPGTPYLNGTSTVPNPSAITVNGYVYLAGSDGLYQYLAGVAKTSLPARSGLTNLATLRATTTDQLIGVDRSTRRIGVWTDATTLSFVTQYQIADAKTLADATYDPSTKTYYALTDGRLVSFPASK